MQWAGIVTTKVAESIVERVIVRLSMRLFMRLGWWGHSHSVPRVGPLSLN